MNEEEDNQIARIDFLRDVDRTIERMRARQEKMFAALTDKERAVLARRFPDLADKG